MKPKTLVQVRAKCPYNDCLERSSKLGEKRRSPNSRPVVPIGFYRRSSDSKRVRRYRCTRCMRSFSSSRLTPCFRQKKRTLNHVIYELFASNMSARRIARHLGINRKTVTRKLLFLGERAKRANEKFLQSRIDSGKKVIAVQFDEMHTFEWTKCKPLSILLAVEEDSRKILGACIASMPASGPLASISLSKYGPRKDERAEKARELFSEISAVICPHAQIRTDQNPHYGKWLDEHFPNATHLTVKGRRGCIVGQGELKKIGFDPLFSLNHTAAMFRANVNRLARRTWCTTKRPDRLAAHLAIYIQYHNEVITERPSR